MNSPLNADLHCHSVVSDGTLTPEALAARAAARGVDLWALTDHDEIGGQHRAMAAARAEGIGYLTNAKISEARNTLGAIMRGAQQAYERETISEAIAPDDAAAFSHALCGSSSIVPVEVPHGDKYQPNPGEFLNDGDAMRGWKCLRFDITNPIYFQYRYAKGTGYVGPARGLPDPGPDGFEVAAVGDLDGDGRTSTFTMVGVVDPKLGTVKTSTQIYCDDPDE